MQGCNKYVSSRFVQLVPFAHSQNTKAVVRIASLLLGGHARRKKSENGLQEPISSQTCVVFLCFFFRDVNISGCFRPHPSSCSPRLPRLPSVRSLFYPSDRDKPKQLNEKGGEEERKGNERGGQRGGVQRKECRDGLAANDRVPGKQ